MVSSLEKTFPIQATVVKLTTRPTNAVLVNTGKPPNSSQEMEGAFEQESSDSVSECFSLSSLSTVGNDDSISNFGETNFLMRAGLPAGKETNSHRLSVRARPDPLISDDESYVSYSSSDLINTSSNKISSVETLNQRNKLSTENKATTIEINPRVDRSRTKKHLGNNDFSELSSDESVFSHGSSSLSRNSSSSQTSKKILLRKTTLDTEEPSEGLNLIVRVILFLREVFPLSPLRRIFRKHHQRQNSNDEFVDMSSCSPIDHRRKRSNSSIKKISFSPLTLLFEAVSERCIAEVRAILVSEPDLDVNSFNANGQSLLHVAANLGGLECVHLLLEYGASVTLKDSEGWTAVHYAIRGGYWKCVILLIEAGSNMADYAQKRTEEFKRVVEMSRSCYITSEVYV